MKPDIVFRRLPRRFFELATQDLPRCKLLLVIGTSLSVQPFAQLVGHVPENCVGVRNRMPWEEGPEDSHRRGATSRIRVFRLRERGDIDVALLGAMTAFDRSRLVWAGPTIWID